MNKEEQMTLRHFQDLSRTASLRNQTMFSDYLNISEQSLLQENRKELSTSFQLFGGRDGCERQIACFMPDLSYRSDLECEAEENYPISCIHVWLPGARFGSASLSHRDYLGAILGLGVDRSKIGDIIVEDQGAYFFCKSNIASFLLNELRQIGRETVRTEEVNAIEALGAPKLEKVYGTVSSCRLDAIIGVAFHVSRSVSQTLIESGKVYVNAKECISFHFLPSPGDIISVRGYGKFRYEGENGQSRKERTRIRLSIYK